MAMEAMANLQIIYLLEMTISNSYVSLPAGKRMLQKSSQCLHVARKSQKWWLNGQIIPGELCIFNWDKWGTPTSHWFIMFPIYIYIYMAIRWVWIAHLD